MLQRRGLEAGWSFFGSPAVHGRSLFSCRSTQFDFSDTTGSQERSYSTIFTDKNPITLEMRYLTAKMAALLPFDKAADFLGELLPLSAQTTGNTVRNRTMKVEMRLQKSARALADTSTASSCEEAVVGLDGGYVRSRHPATPERTLRLSPARCSTNMEMPHVLLLCARAAPRR